MLFVRLGVEEDTMLFRSNTMFIIVCVVPIPIITPVCCTTGMYMSIALRSHGKNDKIVLFPFSTPTLHGMQFYHVFNLIWRPNFGILSIRDNNRQEIRIHHSYRQMEYFFLGIREKKNTQNDIIKKNWWDSRNQNFSYFSFYN